MAFLDIIGLGSDKQAVVLDIGEAFTKVGFAGEPIPRHVIRSEIKRLKGDKLEVVNVRQENCGEEQLYGILRDFLHRIYFKYLLVNPKERRVVVSESVLCSVKFRNVLAKVLFEHFEVVSLLLAPSHLLAHMTLGIPSALVVDCGYRETLVLPIYESTPILNAMEDMPLGAHELHRTILADVIDQGSLTDQDGKKAAASALTALREEVIEDLKVKALFVGRYGAPQSLTPPPALYPLAEDRVVEVPGCVRCHTYDIFFNGNDEGRSLPSIILDSILRCPIDCRKTLAKNILLVGGTVMAAGFESRLLLELNNLLSCEPYSDKLAFKSVQLRRAPVPPNYASWLGGAIFGALETLGDISISREKYKDNPRLPDWACILQYNQNEQAKDGAEKSAKWQSYRKPAYFTSKSLK